MKKIEISKKDGESAHQEDLTMETKEMNNIEMKDSVEEITNTSTKFDVFYNFNQYLKNDEAKDLNLIDVTASKQKLFDMDEDWLGEEMNINNKSFTNSGWNFNDLMDLSDVMFDKEVLQLPEKSAE
ncbi:hypothetical protein HK100_011002, partial [Physocladia obscura]